MIAGVHQLWRILTAQRKSKAVFEALQHSFSLQLKGDEEMNDILLDAISVTQDCHVEARI
jgi:hypothetical protein